jgi:hypothetical protein
MILLQLLNISFVVDWSFVQVPPSACQHEIGLKVAGNRWSECFIVRAVVHIIYCKIHTSRFQVAVLS